MYEFIITFRETLEAVLIVSIFYTLAIKFNDSKAITTLWKAVIASIIASIGIAFLMLKLTSIFNNSRYEKLTEALLMYLAAGFILYMIFWMQKQVFRTKTKAEGLLKTFNYHALFFLLFFAITREGFETALFLIASNNVSSFSYVGFSGGIVLAIGIGYFIVSQGKKLNLKIFFHISSVLLLFFAAAMIAYGTHEMEEFLVKSGHIDANNISRVWDILQPSTTKPARSFLYTYDNSNHLYTHLLHDKGKVGVFLKGFFGYNSNPNFVEFFAWISTVLITFYLWTRSKKG